MNGKNEKFNQSQKITSRNYKEARRSLFDTYPSKHLFNNHDKRVKEIRYCAICGRQLTRYRVKDNKYETIVKHFKLDNFDGFVPLSICWDVRYCGGHLRTKEKKEDLKNKEV